MPSSEIQPHRRHAPGAYAIIKGDPPQIFLAENASVISRVIALKVVAAEDPQFLGKVALSKVQDALLEERWADAVLAWMIATDTAIDVYEEFVPIWTDHELDEEMAPMEIRMSRIFEI